MSRLLSGWKSPTLWLLAVPCIYLTLFFILPILSSVGQSFGFAAMDFTSYKRLVDVAVYRSVFQKTFEVALFVAVICVVVGYICAYFVASLSPKSRGIVVGLISLPFMLSVLVRNYVWMLLLQDTGLINRMLTNLGITDHPLPLMYNRFAVVVAMVNMLLPYAILPILSSLLAVPKELSTASQSLGASGFRTFVRVTLPLTASGAAVGGLLTFIVGLGFYITPAMLGGTREMMVANLIAFNVREALNWPLAFSLSTSLLASTIAFYLLYRMLLPKATVLKAS